MVCGSSRCCCWVDVHLTCMPSLHWQAPCSRPLTKSMHVCRISRGELDECSAADGRQLWWRGEWGWTSEGRERWIVGGRFCRGRWGVSACQVGACDSDTKARTEVAKAVLPEWETPSVMRRRTDLNAREIQVGGGPADLVVQVGPLQPLCSHRAAAELAWPAPPPHRQLQCMAPMHAHI